MTYDICLSVVSKQAQPHNCKPLMIQIACSHVTFLSPCITILLCL